MTERAGLFEFETDFAGNLRCIPMFVRLKLDLCGVKLSLLQWNRFTADDRAMLLDRPCQEPGEIRDYADRLVALIETRAGEAAVRLPVDPDPAWADAHSTPDRVRAQAARAGLPPPTAEAWRNLSLLGRFALFKLSRPGHDNDNFIPALREFGLA
jgi:hypothetical protein